MPQPHKTANQGTFLSLLDATFRLGERLVFEDTCWTFQRDEHWAVVGPNGSGKSLFADAIRGRLPLVGGQLKYHFRPLQGTTAEEAIGHVSFEERKSQVHDLVVQSRWNSIEEKGALLVREFLSYDRVMDINPFEVSASHRLARASFGRRLRRATGLLQIRPFLDRTLLSLSNGERQRVQLAGALCHPLRLLILDEPFSGLDVANRAQFHRVLERLMNTRLRVLLITTRAEDLPRQITHVLHLEACKVVAAGRRDKVMTRPRNRAGAGYDYEGEREQDGSSLRTVPTTPRPNASEPDEVVRLRNVTVRYGRATILRNVNWAVRAGESWALLGPNGSGKTTLLSLIQGDNPQAYQNHVAVFGRRRGTGESIWELKRRIGWVSPELHLHFNASLTCFEAAGSGFHETIGLFEPLTARQRADTRRWLARFQLLEFASTPLYALSAGQQRMVLLARALMKCPRLLILDEPCQGLDNAHRDLFIRTVDTLIRHGSVTAIYVTHREDEIPPSIRRVLRLSGGLTAVLSGRWISAAGLFGHRPSLRK